MENLMVLGLNAKIYFKIILKGICNLQNPLQFWLCNRKQILIGRISENQL